MRSWFCPALLIPLSCVPLLGFVGGCGSESATPSAQGGLATEPIELLNVSYDPTRELWRDLNSQFTQQYEQETGRKVTIKQSHGGSGTQARSVIDGLEADVVTLAMWSDTNAVSRAGLIEPGWEDRLPERSLPYTSTIVFVVRKGNPKGIRDWADLVKPGVEIVTPNPKTSGNGKLSFLAAWGSVIKGGGTEDEAKAFVEKLYKQVPVLDSGARAATVTFAQKGIGDVHLGWENEAWLEVEESKGQLEVVYPTRSIRAEPHVAVVDANAKRHGASEVAEAYLRYAYSEPGQETIAKHHYRPSNPQVLERFSKELPPLELFSIGEIARDWADADERFFKEGQVFDQIFTPPQP